LFERQRFLEIPAGVALHAAHGLVFALQWILGLGVIEVLAHILKRDPLPPAGVMARLAALLAEASFVRISVAVIATAERNPHVTRLVVRAGSVALLARNLGMQPGQRVLGLRVVELRDVLPVFEVVALLAIRPQAAIVLVLVTSGAGLGNTQERAAAISYLNAEPLTGGNTIGGVTAV